MAEHGPAPGQSFRDTLRGGGEGPEMVVIPAGNFRVGSDNGKDDEKPVHRVTISRAFALGKHEVTLAEFRAFETGKGHLVDTGGGDE